MSTPIHVQRPIVNANGTLTQYGWQLLLGFYNATGGTQPNPAGEVKAGALGPIPTDETPDPTFDPVALLREVMPEALPLPVAREPQPEVGPIALLPKEQEFAGARMTGGLQGTTSGSFHPVTFGTTGYDTGSIVSGDTFVVPANWKYVALNSRVSWAAATGRRLVQITQNGSSIAADDTGDTAGKVADHGCQMEIDVTAGDAFALRAFQDSGGALDITAAAFTISKRG